MSVLVVNQEDQFSLFVAHIAQIQSNYNMKGSDNYSNILTDEKPDRE